MRMWKTCVKCWRPCLPWQSQTDTG